MSDSCVGFHAQQAVEKYLKAALALNEVPVRKTHDIGALLGQLAELGVELPDGIDGALELTPYSVLEGYPMAPRCEDLDRKGVLNVVSAFARGRRRSSPSLIPTTPLPRGAPGPALETGGVLRSADHRRGGHPLAGRRSSRDGARCEAHRSCPGGRQIQERGFLAGEDGGLVK